MIQDSFIESHIVRDNGTKGVLFKVFIIITAAIFIVLLNLVPILLGINIIFITGMLSAAIVWGVVVLIRRQYVEYEIEISNELFNVARIFARSKREELAEFSIRDCEYIGPVTCDRFSSDRRDSEFELKVTSNSDFPVTDDYWYTFVNSEGVKYIVIFHFKPEMYKVFRRYNPRNTAPYVAEES